MRILLGKVLGVVLTIGVVYLHDTQFAGKPGIERQMVNWDVVGRNFDSFTGMVKDGWNRLTK